MAAQTYTADRRLYLDANGVVVEADDPNRATLLVQAGGTLPHARAVELGLLEAPSDDEKAADAPAANKAKARPAANKAKTTEGTSEQDDGQRTDTATADAPTPVPAREA